MTLGTLQNFLRIVENFQCLRVPKCKVTEIEGTSA